MSNLVAHVEIPVSNLERAMDFYREVLGIAFGDVAEIHGNRMAFFHSMKVRMARAARWRKARFMCRPSTAPSSI
jgi:predicted enzyme related to lactoylglutathione lyase